MRPLARLLGDEDACVGGIAPTGEMVPPADPTRTRDLVGLTKQAVSAPEAGTTGITFRARKARDAGEWARAVERLRCEVDSRGH